LVRSRYAMAPNAQLQPSHLQPCTCSPAQMHSAASTPPKAVKVHFADLSNTSGGGAGKSEIGLSARLGWLQGCSASHKIPLRRAGTSLCERTNVVVSGSPWTRMQSLEGEAAEMEVMGRGSCRFGMRGVGACWCMVNSSLTLELMVRRRLSRCRNM
jgi:hypothetical protein